MKNTIFAAVLLLALSSAPSFADPVDIPMSDEEIALLANLKAQKDFLGMLRLWEETESTTDIGAELRDFPFEDVMPALRVGLLSKNSGIAGYCFRWLAVFQDKYAFDYVYQRVFPPPLADDKRKLAIEIAKDLGNPDFHKRVAAREKLIGMGAGVVEILTPLMKDDDPEVAFAATLIIAEVRPPIRDWEIDNLHYFDDPRAADILRSIIVTGDSHPLWLVGYAIGALGWRGTAADGEIIRPYLDAEWPSHAIHALGRLKDKNSVPRLIELLDDNRLVQNAVWALGNIGDSRAVPALEEHLAKVVEPSLKRSFIVALARCGEKKHLRDALANMPESNMGYELFEACGNDEIELIRNRLANTKDANLQVAMVLTLSRLAPPADQTAIRTIKTLRAKSKPPSEYDVDYFAIALIKLGDKDEENAILARLKDKNPRVRVGAMRTLGYTKDPKYFPVLLEACNDRESYIIIEGGPTHEVRETAIAEFSRIGAKNSWVWLWSLNPDGQIAEIKAWYAKYQEQKAAEQKPGEN